MYFRDVYLLVSFFLNIIKSFQVNWAFHFNYMIISFYLAKIIVNIYTQLVLRKTIKINSKAF